MKILHTADWHLGKSFNNHQLLEEQKYALAQIIEMVKKHQPSVVLLSGDIYDRSVPPADAVRVFDEVLSKIILELKTPVIAIAGNHDSPERIGYGAGLLEKQGLHITGMLSLPVKPVVLTDQFGEIYFYPIPYTEPETLRFLLRDTADAEKEIRTHVQVMEYLVADIEAKHPKGKRAVMIGHAFVAEAKEDTSESERDLMVGGAAYIPSEVFSFFDYVALGHLHKPLSFLGGKLKYAGSLFKYSFSEANYAKSVVLLEMGAQGEITHERLPLIPEKEVRRVKGRIKERKFYLEEDTKIEIQKEDLLEVSLLNEEVVPNAMQIIQKSYPNALVLKWTQLPSISQIAKLTTASIRDMSEEQLFHDFFKNMTQKTLEQDKEKAEVLINTIKEIKQGE